MSVTQFKLSNGEEIICEVIDEPTGEDVNLVIRNAMLIMTIDTNPAIRYYSFRPWMVYQLDSNYMQLLNFTHIIGEAKPDTLMKEQYLKALEAEQDNIKTNRENIDKKIEEIMEKLDAQEAALYRDSSKSNVIQFSFTDKDKLH